jgi:hypothetical protein
MLMVQLLQPQQNGKVETQVFEGTDAEVQAKIDALK